MNSFYTNHSDFYFGGVWGASIPLLTQIIRILIIILIAWFTSLSTPSYVLVKLFSNPWRMQVLLEEEDKNSYYEF